MTELIPVINNTTANLINRVEQFDDKKIDIIICETKDGSYETWFRGKDVASILGYKRTRDSLKDHVKLKNKYKLIELYENFRCTLPHLTFNEKNTIYINKVGLIELLICSKMPNKDIFINWCNNKFNINCYVIIKLCKEQETIGQIILAFKHLNYKTQYTVNKYRIDLYFPDYKLAIECDEFNHNDRDQDYEIEREEYITTKLNCKFIRYNPDHPEFTIFEVINRIIIEIKS